MKILLGTAGIPLSTKKYSTIDGIKRVAELKLTVMEIAFVRSVYLSEKAAQEVGEVAKKLGVSLSIHAPYYINLNSTDKSVVEASKKRILESADRAESMGAEAIAIHSAYYSNSNPEQTFENVKANFLDILDRMKQKGIKNVRLGVETMGRKSQFGSLDETIRLHKEVKQVIPYIDFAHVFVRGNGKINYTEILDKLEKLKLDCIYSHFEGVKYSERSKSFIDAHMPISNNPPFEPLAEEVMKRRLNIRIISESPILEDDAFNMKKVFEKLGHSF